jgi:uncharacterized protein (TIGR03437 family)
MCPDATNRLGRSAALSALLPFLFLLLPWVASAQAPENLVSAQTLAWRQIGGTVWEAGLASPAGGPVARVWYSADGLALYALGENGRIFETPDFETWTETAGVQPPAAQRVVRGEGPFSSMAYTIGDAVYRSADQGRNWEDVTTHRARGILGGGFADIAVSPLDGEELVVANRFGVWRSLDGGISWTGLNLALPNFPAARIVEIPEDGRGLQVLLDSTGQEVEWLPGEQSVWIPAGRRLSTEREVVQGALSVRFGVRVTASAAAGGFVYAGTQDGRLFASPDTGANWRSFSVPGAGALRSIFADAADPRTVLAVGDGPRVFRTINGGLFWDDLTADLPPGDALAVTADLETGAIYLGTASGLYFTLADLVSAGPATPWIAIREGLPRGAVRDVRQDAGNHRLYVCVEGHGVFTAMAPHRLLSPKLINAADWSGRPAAPGSLLSLLGREVVTARSGNLSVPVLAATPAESQIQVPFESTGGLFSVAFTGRAGSRALAVPLRIASPAIFIDRDGSPMVLDGETEVLLDRMNPARAGSVIRVLATGLGRVTPEWPTGLAAPLENPPAVAAPVRVFLDGTPVEVLSATLAPGYICFYLVEIQVPKIVNQGAAELYIEAAGQRGNRVRLYVVQ